MNKDSRLRYTRLANLNDTKKIVQYSTQLGMTTAYADLPLDEEKLTRVVETIIMSTPAEMLMLSSVDDDGNVVGFLAGTLFEVVFTSEQLSMEIGWFVDPAADNAKKRYLELREAFEEWTRRKGCRYAQYGKLNPDEKDFNDLRKNKKATVIEIIYHRDVREENKES